MGILIITIQSCSRDEHKNKKDGIEMTQEVTAMLSFVIARTNKPKIGFDAAVTGAIDVVFSSLGDPVKQAIYSKLENTYGLKREDVPLKIQEFTEALEQIFGTVSKIVEIKIIEKLHVTYGEFTYVSKEEDLSFVEYAGSLKLYFESAA